MNRDTTRDIPRDRSLLVVALCAFLPLVAPAVFAVLEAARSYQTADEARLRGAARGVAAAADAHLSAYVSVARALSYHPMLDSGGDLARFVANARPIGAEFGGWFVIIGPGPEYEFQAITLAGAQPMPPRLRDPSLDPALVQPLAAVFERGEAAVSDLFTGPVSGRPLIWALAPVRRDGRVTRAIGLAFEPSQSQALLARQDLPLGGFAAVADANRRIVATSIEGNAALLGRPIPASAAAEAGRAGGLFQGRNLRGEETIFASERLQTAPGWSVVVASSRAVQLNSARRVIGWTLAGALALLLGLAAVGSAAWRQTLRATQDEAAALRSGRAEIERLLGNLPAVVFLRAVEPGGQAQLLHQSGDTAAVFGWPAERFVRLSDLTELVAPGTLALVPFMQEVLRAGSGSTEWRLRQPDGSLRWMRTTARVLSRWPDGGAEVVGYIVNIHAERAAAARAAASGRLAALGEMAAGLAHEVKQPLAVIALAAENAARALRAGKPDGATGRLARIAAQAARAGELIEHLRRFARGAEEGEVPGPVPLRQALDGALALVGASLRDADVAFEVALGPSPGPVVMAQLVPLEQVLTNLIANARDAFAGQPAGVVRRLRIGAAVEGGLVRITVADTAGGIPDAVMARLFEPFVTTKDADRGTGLGLSICHGLVRGMGGTIEARNTGEGAAFSITLAAAPGLAAAGPERLSA
ncbi:ATP-binding protein [Dankookia sp. GCM10030260]|uniref:ATP-binding protein n=1 Tax=Dankookia sp. GCM10030260 TaxID=3273390 RepID=UPI00361DE2C4